jgi:alpha-beta hydrolase superfamily lysophospholipase
MHTLRIAAVFCLAVLFSGCCGESCTGKAVVSKPKTIVIVHGAWGGGWAFKEVDGMLSAQGHTVYRPTLTGQGERVHLASAEVGLDTHIDDVVNTILFEELDDIVLIGHSYGGMVVTGVADRVPERISRMIYLDAMIPYDGESSATMGTRGGKKPGWMRNSKDGFIVPTWVPADKKPPKDVPHQVKTLTDVLSLKNPERMKIRTDYILTVDDIEQPEKDGFFASAKRAKEAEWPVHHLEADHNPQWSKPKELVDMFNEILK